MVNVDFQFGELAREDQIFVPVLAIGNWLIDREFLGDFVGGQMGGRGWPLTSTISQDFKWARPGSVITPLSFAVSAWHNFLPGVGIQGVARDCKRMTIGLQKNEGSPGDVVTCSLDDTVYFDYLTLIFGHEPISIFPILLGKRLGGQREVRFP